MTLEEVKEQQRIVDQTLSGHAFLRDRFRRRAMVADILLFLSSIILCALVFLDSDSLAKINISPTVARWVIGVCSLTNFFLSILSLLLDWKGSAEKFRKSTAILADLKADCRRLIKGAASTADECAAVCARCSSGLTQVPEIPERLFPKAKAHHHRKVALSKAIDSHAGVPIWMLRTHLFFTSSAKLFKKKTEEPHE